MPGRLRQQSEEVELPFICGARAASRCPAEVIPGVGNYDTDFRGGSRTVRPDQGPQYYVKVSRGGGLCTLAGLAHSLQVGQVSESGCLIMYDDEDREIK